MPRRPPTMVPSGGGHAAGAVFEPLQVDDQVEPG
jgi:hypothetical protein